MRTFVATATVMVALMALAPNAHASGFAAVGFGGEHGHPTTDSLTAIYFNPAGLALLGGTRLVLDGTFAFRSFTHDRDPGAIDNIMADATSGSGTPAGDGVAANSGKGELFNVLASPFIGAATDFGVPNLGVGLAFYVPFGGQSVWDKADSSDKYPGAEDGPQRWWIIDGSIRSMYLTAAAAYQIPELRLSVGASFNLVMSSVNTLRARNPDGTDHLVSGGSVFEGRAHVDVSGIDPAIGAGLIWQPIDPLFVGVSYQSQPAFGRMKLEGELTQILGSATQDVEPEAAEFHQGLPDVVRFGARWTMPQDYELRLSGSFTRWSSFDVQCVLNLDRDDRLCDRDNPVGQIVNIPRDWQDTWGIRVGASYWVNPDLEVYLGSGWDGNAVPDHTAEPSLYDSDKFNAAVGAKLHLLDRSMVLKLTWTQWIYLTREIEPRVRIPSNPNDPQGPTITDIESDGLPTTLRDPNAAGTFTHSIGALNVSAEYRF